MSKRMNLRLGTRPSLLAIAQSRLVARALERRYPELGVELVNVCTRGDRDRHTPLTRVNDPGFFAAELDEALRGGDVDFCVHSYKDLGPDRPADIALAAIPPRPKTVPNGPKTVPKQSQTVPKPINKTKTSFQ